MAVAIALALETESIKIGTSVVQTYPRHPQVLASESNVVDQIAPGRFRLGIGPSHRAVMELMGIKYDAPLGHLREYLQIVRTLLATGEVDFEGTYYQTKGTIAGNADVPVMIGTLQPSTFALVGEMADGAITWLCPPSYIAEVAIPTMRKSAESQSRPTPPLIAHLAVCLHSDGDEVRDEVRRTIPNIRLPSYQRMLTFAGHPSAQSGIWTDSLIDDIVAWGDDDHIASRIGALFDAGADEVLIRPLGAGIDKDAVVERTVAFVGSLTS